MVKGKCPQKYTNVNHQHPTLTAAGGCVLPSGQATNSLLQRLKVFQANCPMSEILFLKVCICTCRKRKLEIYILNC